MGETILDEKTVICSRGEDEAHLSRQGLAASEAAHTIELLREVSVNARETLKALSDVRDTVRAEGEKTRLQSADIARENLAIKLADARAELLWFRKSAVVAVPVAVPST